MSEHPTFAFDEWTFHVASGELERAGARTRLQDLPAQLLTELLGHPGELVTREQLIARLWPKGVIDFETGLNSAVRKLRLALGDDADAPRFIETVPRKGYRFIGLPREFPAPIAQAEEPVVTFQAPIPEMRARKKSRVVAVIALAVAGLTAVVSLLAIYGPLRRHVPEAQRTFETSAAARLRLAILPFANLDADSANGFLADGLHEEILTTLASRATNLDVISRTTMMTYRAAPKSLREIARELNVTHVLEGSVRREGHTVRLTVQLIDAMNDVHLWSKNFDREVVDVMSLQSQVAEEVGSQLAVKLSGKITELPRSRDPRAYDLYMQARMSMLTVFARRSLQEQNKALELLDSALAIDREFAAAYVERARVRLARFASSQDLSDTNLDLLRADLAAARRLMGDAPPLLISEADYALLVDLDADESLRLLNLARIIHPNSSEVFLMLARNLASAGKRDEAFAYFQRAAALDPANPTIVADWAACLRMALMAQESLRLSRDFDARYPRRITYGWRQFVFTGDFARFESELDWPDATGDAGAQLAARFDLYLYDHRFDELKGLLEHTSLTTIPQVSFGMLAVPAIGGKPVAELRGWVQLLEGNPAAAAEQGRIVQDFVVHERATKYNAWHLRLLAAEGALFTGDKRKAAGQARAALREAPRHIHIGIQRYAPAVTARVLAWAGAEGDAMDLLEKLSREFPSMGPADIARDPLYSVPLANNVRYQALAKKLEADIAANQKLIR